MAFTKAPETSTYKTQRFPVVGVPLQRDGNVGANMKDQRFLNCYPEKVSAESLKTNQFYLRKRPGLQYQFGVTADEARGIIWDETSQQLYGVTGFAVWVYDGVSVTQLGLLGTNTGPVGWTIHLTTTLQVVLLDGIAGYVIDPNTNIITQISDPDFPTPHIPDPVSMDGYLFIAKAGTADIYNSDLDNVFGWTPGNFITAEMYPDFMVSLAKNNNYIYAVGSSSVEFFYDAGVATGSPLQRNDSAVLQFGTPAPGSVYMTEKEVIMIGSTQNGGRTVWMIDGFKATEIAIEAVKMALDNENAAIASCNCYCVRTGGHKFYVLRLTSSKRTFVYDFEEKLWHEWSGFESDGLTPGLFRGAFAADSFTGAPYIQDSTKGYVYLMKEDQYTDHTDIIKVQMQTEKVDLDNMNRKDFHRMTIFGDWPLDTVSALLTVEWSDDDYRTWKGSRTVNLSQDLPVVRRLGKARRRAFRFTFTAAYPFRIEGYELDTNQGQT